MKYKLNVEKNMNLLNKHHAIKQALRCEYITIPSLFITKKLTWGIPASIWRIINNIELILFPSRKEYMIEVLEAGMKTKAKANILEQGIALDSH